MANSNFSFGGITISEGTKRLYISATLIPSTDDPRIQPTGFPDIGPVFYPDPSGKHGQICLIESEASMANRLEEVCMADKYTGTLLPELAGLPYIKLMQGDRFMTASTLDAHRFASAHILGSKTKNDDQKNGDINANTVLVDFLKTELGVDPSDSKGKNVPAANVPGIFRLAMELDPMSLIHGFQISSDKLSFVGLRSARALTGSIVGLNAELVGVPGIKFDPLVTGKAAEGYQPIFRKERIVAKTIQANFALDLGLLTGLAVGPKPADKELDDRKKTRNEETTARHNLLVALSLWKVAKFLKELSDGRGLRTECHLALKSAKYKTKWKDEKPAEFPYEQIVSEGEKKGDGDKPAKGSLQELIEKAKLPKNRDPLALEFTKKKEEKE